MGSLPTAQEFVSRWQQGVQGKQDRYRQGIQGTNDWAEKTLAAADSRNAGLMRAINDGSIDDGIRNTGSAGWRNKTLAKGPQNWASGVAAAGPQMQQGAQKLLNMLGEALGSIQDVPRGDLEQNIARSAAFQRAMAQAKRRQ